jgi:hypothetical protein
MWGEHIKMIYDNKGLIDNRGLFGMDRRGIHEMMGWKNLFDNMDNERGDLNTTASTPIADFTEHPINSTEFSEHPINTTEFSEHPMYIVGKNGERHELPRLTESKVGKEEIPSLVDSDLGGGKKKKVSKREATSHLRPIIAVPDGGCVELVFTKGYDLMKTKDGVVIWGK